MSVKLRRFLLAGLFASSVQLFAWSNPGLFLLHHNEVFVETGSFYGQGIFNALSTGYKKIHSIELAPKYYYYCQERFEERPNILIHYGDSSKVLYDIIRDIDEPITFWLDAHFSGDDTAFFGRMTPILDELDQIKRHHLNTHTIMIDDVRHFGTWHFDYISKEQILDKLYEINPNYSISYAKGYVADDILIAEVK